MKKFYISLIICVSVALVSVADTFDTAVDRIVQANPEMKVMAARIYADSLTAVSENYLPDPEISIETLFGRQDNKYNLEISQGFDWPGVYKARARAMEASSAVQLAQIAAAQSEIRMQVAELLLEVVASRKKISVYEDILGRIVSMHDLYHHLLDQGDVTIVNVNKLCIELADYEQMLGDERQTMADNIARLQAMALGVDVEGIVADIDEFPIVVLGDKNAYIQAMADNSPELVVLQRQLDHDRANTEVTRMSKYPGLSVGYHFSHEDGQAYNGFTLGVSLPVWGAKARRQAAEAAAKVTSLEYDTAINALTKGIEADYATAVSLKERIDEYGRALTLTDNMGLLQRAFDARQITLTDYIQDMRYFTEAQLRMYDLQLAYARALQSLNRFK